MMALNARSPRGPVRGSITMSTRTVSESSINCPAVLPEDVTIKVELPDIFLDNTFDDEIEPILHKRDSFYDNFFERVIIKQEVIEEGEIIGNNSNLVVLKAPKEERIEERPAFAAVFIKEEEEDGAAMYDESGREELNRSAPINQIEMDDDDVVEIIPNETKKPPVLVINIDTKETIHNQTVKTFVKKGRPSFKPYECAHCPARFREKFNLRQHILTHSCQEQLSCPRCPRKFVYPGNLERHMREHKSCKIYPCPSCDAKFSLKRLLNEHIQQHYFPLPCPNCKARFSHRRHLNNHLKIHAGGPASKSPVISTPSKTNVVDEIMEKNFTPPKKSDSYDCGYCKAMFKNKPDLAEHTILEHMNKPEKVKKHKPETFRCHICPSRFRQEATLEEHIRLHANKKPRQHYACTNCTEKFTKPEVFKEHMKAHLKDKPLKCKRCFEQFALVSHLKSHLKMCTKVKPYSCIRCPAEFTLKKDLQEHFKTQHSVDPLFTCAHCFAEFNRKEDLASHIKIHPFEHPCPICPTTLNLESDLKAHLKIHAEDTFPSYTGVQLIPHIKDNFDSFNSDTYICGHCSAKFSDKETLVEHLRVHLDQKPRYLGVFTKPPFSRTSLVNEMKKNFANIKLRLGKN